MVAIVSTPFTVTAILRQGVAFDQHHGVAFDGLVAGILRNNGCDIGLGQRPSVMDKGLAADTPTDWMLPFGECSYPAYQDRHWLVTTGLLLDRAGNPYKPAPDVHRLLNVVNTPRLETVAGVVPAQVSPLRGRYRNKLTPVVFYPCAAIQWRGVGFVDEIRKLVENVPAIGSRRGSGEGAVARWSVVGHSEVDDPIRFAHTHVDGMPGRGYPQECFVQCGFPTGVIGVGGIRPPLFHKERQRQLMFVARR